MGAYWASRAEFKNNNVKEAIKYLKISSEFPAISIFPASHFIPSTVHFLPSLLSQLFNQKKPIKSSLDHTKLKI